MSKRKNIFREAALICETKFQVRFSEVDAMKIVWHGDYAHYFEDGREAFGQKYSGIGYLDIYESGYLTPIVDMRIEYKSSLTIGDTAIVETRYIAHPGAKICFDYIIRKESDGTLIATGYTVQVFLNKQRELELISPDFYQNWKKKWGIQ